MPTSHENALQQRCQQIVTSPVLSPEQKRHFLALEAENNLPYPQLPAEARRALDEGVICDMFEGHAPYKPRYVLARRKQCHRRTRTWTARPRHRRGPCLRYSQRPKPPRIGR